MNEICCATCGQSVGRSSTVSFRTGSTTKILCPDCAKRELEVSADWWPLHGLWQDGVSVEGAGALPIAVWRNGGRLDLHRRMQPSRNPG